MDSSSLSEQNRPVIELGWVVDPDLSDLAQKAVIWAQDRMVEGLQRDFGAFRWQMPVVRRALGSGGVLEEPAALLQEGSREREARHWDFAFVVTRGTLRSYGRSYALATPSRAINVAALSLARLVSVEGEGELLGRRLLALAYHLLGDLNDLAHSDDSELYMYQPRSADELDGMGRFTEEERGELAEEFAAVADVRLEESPQAPRTGSALFHVRASWIGRGVIASAVWQAKPWQLPFRLPRLTTAAISALLVLLMTAEVWDLGMSLSWGVIGGLSAGALISMVVFIIERQNLLLRRGRPHLTEQIVFTNITMVLVVLLGLLVSYIMLFGTALALMEVLFGSRIAAQWAASVDGPLSLGHYLRLSGFIAALGIIIGALGASFEGQDYFRHITYVDEET